MKNIILFIILFITTNLSFSQNDTIKFKYNKKQYNHKGMLFYKNLLEKEPNIFPFKIKQHSYKAFNFYSIPIFKLNGKPYKCGEDIVGLIDFKNDPLFQIVLIIYNNRVLDSFEIYDSYYDTVKNNKNKNRNLLLGTPVGGVNEINEKRLYRYMLKYPDDLVFMIQGLDGYWAINNRKIIKLSSSIFGINKKESRKYLCDNYGKEYINDIINQQFKNCYPYKTCSKCPKLSKKIIKLNY